MSDDGLLLNFAPSSVAGPSKPTSQKVQQRRSQSNGGKKDVRGANASHRPMVGRTEDTMTTSKVAPPTKPSISESSQKKRDSARISASSSTGQQQSTKPSGKPQRGTAVISSLFAGADALHEDVTKAQEERIQRDPTNAPSKVTDFASLQLDPLLVSHLASDKMNKITRPTGFQRTALPFLLSDDALRRDALLHAQTGSGKTLCYLLPIMQSLLPYCQASWIDRSCLGTLAIILAPTRELARQIYDVAEALCSLHLGDSNASVRRTRWIVPGLLSGGATKNHEKSRIRKGIPLIVATPGRLLDHLRNTASLDVGRLQWLVLDEADRLLHMGFEETLNDILKAIDGRRRAACDVQRQRMRDELGNQFTGQHFDDEEVLDTFGELWWRFGRRSVLCSATLDEGVQVLAGKSLRDPKVIRADTTTMTMATDDGNGTTEHVAAPAQLSQNYVITPTKQRLVLLVALIRRAIARPSTTSSPTKMMVFLSCTDSVDFHLAVLRGVSMARDATYDDDEKSEAEQQLEHSSQLFPSTSLFKLHGSMTAHTRQASLKAFIQCKQTAVLFCTSVASRGLDLHVSHVVQVDPPTEKGVDEYVHRIGRTARAGAQGESWLMLLPSEEACVGHYNAAAGQHDDDDDDGGGGLRPTEAVRVLREGFGGADLTQTQTRATDAQMALERWTAGNERNAMRARRAYLSHLRAYATHSPDERAMFAVGALQLGHLAKAFALREAPAAIRAKVQQAGKEATTKEERESKTQKRKRTSTAATDDGEGKDLFDADDDEEARRTAAPLQFKRNEQTEARMYAKVRELGKLHKRQGVLGDYGGADEFQLG